MKSFNPISGMKTNSEETIQTKNTSMIKMKPIFPCRGVDLRKGLKKNKLKSSLPTKMQFMTWTIRVEDMIEKPFQQQANFGKIVNPQEQI